VSAPHDPEKHVLDPDRGWEPVFGQHHAANGSPNDLACELLAQSLTAWRAAGQVVRAADGALVIGGGRKEIRIDRAPSHVMFRWMVTVDGRKRGAISLVAVLRQVREALDPGYAANRVRIAVAPLVPAQ
jgi:hypothetical protein